MFFVKIDRFFCFSVHDKKIATSSVALIVPVSFLDHNVRQFDVYLELIIEYKGINYMTPL